jgi:hypothetical protein
LKREKKTERREFPTSQKEHTAPPLKQEALGRTDCLHSFDTTWTTQKKIKIGGHTENNIIS